MKDSKKKASVADIVILLAIMLVAAYMFAASNSFAAETKLFPQIVSAVVFLCCVGKLALTVWTLRAPKSAAQGGDAPSSAGGKHALLSKNQLMVLVIAVLYVALLNPIGFLPSTIAVLIALPYLLGYRKWKVLIPFAVIITVAFYVIFRYGFYIKLPAGILSGIL
nr:tripartite tricarboxylate transporter TctB family protein [uncultured Oscillibacter sp.]